MYRKDFDVAVCGGGIAGVAAALTAARRGMKTVLIEKTILPGGLATSGLVDIFLPICDGKGTQLIFGVTEELLLAANKYGPSDPNKNWKTQGRYIVDFSPAAMVLSMDELLEEAGVEIWYDTIICGAEVEKERLTAVQVLNKSGMGKIGAKVFVDATGDADVAFLAGCPCRYSPNSMTFWTVEYRQGSDAHLLGENVRTGIYADPLSNVYTEKPLSGEVVTDFVLEGRRRYRKLLQSEYASGLFTRQTHFPLSFQTMPPIRKTRCITGKFTLESGMAGRAFEDSLGSVGDWRAKGSVWQIPYSALLPVNVKGLLAAGRCISSIEDAWEVTRVIPVASMTGEAAGMAAAEAVRAGVTPDQLKVSDFRK